MFRSCEDEEGMVEDLDLFRALDVFANTEHVGWKRKGTNWSQDQTDRRNDFEYTTNNMPTLGRQDIQILHIPFSQLSIIGLVQGVVSDANRHLLTNCRSPLI